MKNYVLCLSVFLSLFSFGNLCAETESFINDVTIIVEESISDNTGGRKKDKLESYSYSSSLQSQLVVRVGETASAFAVCSIYNLAGDLVLSSTCAICDGTFDVGGVNTLSTGTYFLKVEIDGQETTITLIVQ